MKKLFLHIGTPKTGTTSLQYFLKENSKQLESHRVFVKSGAKINNEEFSLMVHNRNIKKIEQYLTEFCNKGDGIYVLSCELLYTLPVSYQLYFSDNKNGFIGADDYETKKDEYIAFLREVLFNFFDEVEIVVFLRRQDDFLNSNYIQDVQFNLSCSAEEYADIFAFEIDYQKNLEFWSRHFGSDNVTPLIYERKSLVDGVEGAFMSLLGLDCKEFRKLSKERNPSITPELFHFKKIFNLAASKIDFERNGIMFKFYGFTDAILNSMKRDNKTFKALPYELSIALLDKFRQGNNYLASKYFGRTDLFHVNSPSYYKVEDKSLTGEEMSEFLSSFIFQVQLDSMYNHKEIMRILKESEKWNFDQDSRIKQLEEEIQFLKTKIK